MRTSSIHYSKVFSLGNYENEKIGVDIEVQEGDDIQKVIQQARQFVEFNHKVNGLNTELEQCDRVISDPDNFTGTEVKRAMERRDQIVNAIHEGTKLLSN